MSSSSSLPKQQQQQQQQRRSKKSNYPSQQSRNTNAYFDRNEYHQHALTNSKHYWNDEYYQGDGDCHQQDYYPSRNGYSPVNRRAKKDRSGKNQQTYAQHSKPIFSSTTTSSNFTTGAPPRHHLHAPDKSKPVHSPPRMSNGVKPSQSPSSTSTNSDPGTSSRKDPQAKNLSPTVATRQQNQPPSPNLGAVQTLMNSLILQQQSAPSQPSSTVHLQNQLTNALLATSRKSNRPLEHCGFVLLS